MSHRNLLALLLVAVPASSVVVACTGDRQDTDARAALEREALERDLELALQPDTTAEPELADVPAALPQEETTAPPRVAPVPAPRQSASAPARSPRPRPAPRPAPAEEPREREPARPAPVTRSVPAGTSFAVRLDEQLSTRSAGVGEGFTATLTEPIYAADGSLLIPAGATVRGHVTESRAAGRAGQTPTLRITFDAISSGGRSYPISATSADVPVRRVTRDSKGEQAAKIGGGAAVGAVLGQVLGKNTKSTVAGAAIGAAAGTAVAIGTAEVDAVIPAGSVVSVRLDESVRVTS